MSAYVIVEFTVKDPDVHREKYGIWPQFRDAACRARAGGCARALMCRLYPWLSHYRVK